MTDPVARDDDAAGAPAPAPSRLSALEADVHELGSRVRELVMLMRVAAVLLGSQAAGVIVDALKAALG